MKKIEYEKLVQKRKGWTFSDTELTNPSQTDVDWGDHIEPWAQWQNDLDAVIMVIGQEYCDLETFKETKGKVECENGKYEYPSNRNIREFLSSIGFDIGHPADEQRPKQPVFMTNCVMGLKPAPMSANFRTKWMRESCDTFLLPLINIIRPKVIVTLGAHATRSVARAYGQRFRSHREAVENPTIIDGMMLCPVYHPGGLGLRNRSKTAQQADWERIRKYL